jgi:hypothetical protein
MIFGEPIISCSFEIEKLLLHSQRTNDKLCQFKLSLLIQETEANNLW